MTGFLLACKNNSLEVVKLLLDIKPDIINQEEEYLIGYMLACYNNSLEVVKLLLDIKPDIINQKKYITGLMK